MAGYDDTNRGAIFKNERKTQSNQPDYRGSVNVDGVEMFCSGWIKVAGPNAKNPGSKFLSLAFEAKDNGFVPAKAPVTGSLFDDMDGDVPFSCGVV